MATLGTYYFDTASFANATALFTDSALTQCAPDGFYSDNIISREQINCYGCTSNTNAYGYSSGR